MAIGGYFELELDDGREYHAGALRFNSASKAFEALLRQRRFSRVYLPHYTCQALVAPLERLSIRFQYYPIDGKLEPIFDYSSVEQDEGFVAINYFGLKDDVISSLVDKVPHLVVDNVQSFYSMPVGKSDTFYSPRKFFGVPDGAYLYTDAPPDGALESDSSIGRCEHLFRRIEYGPENGYPYFLENEERLHHAPIRKMSNLTHGLLRNINYAKTARRRIRNFQTLHEALASDNQLKLVRDGRQVPMVYPFLPRAPILRQDLIKEKIYVAQYWPNLSDRLDVSSIEYHLAEGLLALPIDQRYGVTHMEKIIGIIRRLQGSTK